jgi:hypothetical protein
MRKPFIADYLRSPMIIYMLLAVLVFAGTLFVIASDPGQNLRIVSAELMQGDDDVSTRLPYHHVPFYLFPFQYNLTTEKDSAVPSKISLASINTVSNTSVTNTSSPANATNATGAPQAWNVVAGKWSPVADGVQAGDELNRIHRILVRPIATNSTNLDLNTSFSIRSVDPNRTSYVSIVYSWTSPQNFKYAGMTFFKNQTYLDFGTVENGTLSWDPPWPGSRIDFEPKVDEPISMQLSIRDDSQELTVNGIELLRETETAVDESGYIGLGYGRVNDITFHQVNVLDT